MKDMPVIAVEVLELVRSKVMVVGPLGKMTVGLKALLITGG